MFHLRITKLPIKVLHKNIDTKLLSRIGCLKMFFIPAAYSVELEKSLRNVDWMLNLQQYVELESKARADFANPNKKWREGTAKTSFTYLLLDPRLTHNLPERASKQNQHVSWVTFVNSIFYVGKGMFESFA